MSLSLCLVSFRPWVGSSTYVSSTLRSYPSSILVSLDLKLVRRYRMIIETGTRSSPMKDSESRMSHHNHTPNLIPKFLKRCTVREPCLRQRIIYELFTTDDNNDDNSNNHYWRYTRHLCKFRLSQVSPVYVSPGPVSFSQSLYSPLHSGTIVPSDGSWICSSFISRCLPRSVSGLCLSSFLINKLPVLQFEQVPIPLHPPLTLCQKKWKRVLRSRDIF